MKSLGFVASTLIVLALTLVSGYWHGRISQRWGPSSDAVKAAEKLQTFPVAFGHWRMQSTNTFDAATVAELRCIGYISRNYQNQETGRAS